MVFAVLEKYGANVPAPSLRLMSHIVNAQSKIISHGGYCFARYWSNETTFPFFTFQFSCISTVSAFPWCLP
jgi:hypothetical protein